MLSRRQQRIAQQVKRDIEILDAHGYVVTERHRAYMRALVRKVDRPLPGLPASNIEDLRLGWYTRDRDKPEAERRLIAVYTFGRGRRAREYTKVLDS